KFSNIVKNPYYDIERLRIFLSLQQDNNIIEFPRLFFNKIEKIFNAEFPSEVVFNLSKPIKLNDIESIIHVDQKSLISIHEALKEMYTLLDRNLDLNF